MQHQKISSNATSPSLIIASIVFVGSLLYTLLSLFSYSFAGGSIPSFIRIPRMSPVFADLRQLTHSSGCGASFPDLVANIVNCDPWKRPFNYTFPSLESFRFFSIDSSSTERLGALIGIFGLVAALIFIFSLVNGRVPKLLLSTAFLLSFPFQLAVERGNHDLLVFGMCLLVPLLVFSPWPKDSFWPKIVLASLLSFSSAALKIFPFLGIAPWSFGATLKPARKTFKYAALLLFFASCLGIFIQTGDLFQIMSNTPKPDGATSFGLLASYQSRFGGSAGMVLTIFKAGVLAIVMKVMLQDKFDELFWSDKNDPRLESSREAALLFSFMFLFAWMISRSWDYRLIICLGFVPFFINIFMSNPSSLVRLKILLAGSMLILWFEQYIGLRLGILSDTLIQPVLLGFLASFLWRNYVNVTVSSVTPVGVVGKLE